jgi:hypothetical protein
LCCALIAPGVMPLSARHAMAQPLACRYEISAVIQAPTCGLGGVSTIGTAINASGTTIVGYRFCLGTAMPWKWTQQTGLVMLTLPPWLVEARPADVNDNNIMVGAGVGTQAGQRGWLCDLNTMSWSELLPQNPPIGWSGASAITSNNTVVGFRSIGSKGDPVHPFNACIWPARGPAVDLGVMSGPFSSAMDVAEDGTIVGWAGGNTSTVSTRAFVWHRGRTTLLPAVPNGFNSWGAACRSVDRVAIEGRVQMVPNVWRGFSYFDGAFADLGVVPNFEKVSPKDIGPADAIVGGVYVDPNQSRGFVWQAGLLRDLNDLLPKNSPFTILDADAISESGIVVARGYGLQQTGLCFLLEPTSVSGDAHPDCTVNVDDLVSVILGWGETNSPADVTGDGVVDVDDLITVILNWTT